MWFVSIEMSKTNLITYKFYYKHYTYSKVTAEDMYSGNF